MILERVATLAAALGPAAALLGYGLARTDSDWRNEAIWVAVLISAACAFIGGAVELLFLALLHHLAWSAAMQAGVAALVIAVAEETGKFIVVTSIAARHVDVRRRQDTLMLAVGAAIGFAAIENLFYLYKPEGWTGVALLRAATAVPWHGTAGLIMGALLMAAARAKRRWALRATALGLPILLHAAYDFPLLLSKPHLTVGWLALGWIGVMILSAVLALILTGHVLAGNDDGFIDEPLFRRWHLVCGGLVLLLLGPSLAAGYAAVTAEQQRWEALALLILPTALGLSLLRTGVRRIR